MKAKKKHEEKYNCLSQGRRERTGEEEKNRQNNTGATKPIKLSSVARTAGSKFVEDDVAEKTGLMWDVVSALKPLGIPSEAGGSTTKTGEFMDTGRHKAVSPAMDARADNANVDEGDEK